MSFPCTPVPRAPGVSAELLGQSDDDALRATQEAEPVAVLVLRDLADELGTVVAQAGNDVVEGIPAEYLQMNGSYEMTPEQRVHWEAEVHSLYDAMVRIVITPTWAKLIDFETTLPSAVEELIRQQAERRRT